MLPELSSHVRLVHSLESAKFAAVSKERTGTIQAVYGFVYRGIHGQAVGEIVDIFRWSRDADSEWGGGGGHLKTAVFQGELFCRQKLIVETLAY